MGYLSDLSASLATQIDLVPTYGEKDALIKQLAEVRQAIGASGGGGEVYTTVTANIGDTGSLVKAKNVTALQTPIALAANTVSTFIIPASCRLMILLTNGADLVYYSMDGSNPTPSNNAWLLPFGKEIWDNNIPNGMTMTFTSTSFNQLIIVARG